MRVLVVLSLISVVVTATTIPPKKTTESVDSSISTTEENSNIDYVVPSASVGNVKIAAEIHEVDGDWQYPDGLPVSEDDDDEEEDNDVDEEADDIVDEEEENDVDEGEDDIVDEEEYDDVFNGYEEAIVEEYEYEEDFADVATQEDFEANVPTAIHGAKDVIINKDNFIPILKTIVLAYTHKEKPSYSDILKAGGISAFKTGFKYLGKENLGANLMTLAKRLTGALDEEGGELNDELLAELAEEYLSSRRFKLVLPESVLLHQREMDEFMSKREIEEIEGRSYVSSRQFDISMPRADPAVQTILTVGPMTWMALLGGLFTIPYLFSGSDTESERVDNFPQDLSPWLQPPGLPFFQTHQLRREEGEHFPHQHVDDEYLEYQKSYDQWYRQWYLRYKNYYDEYYPNHQQPQPSGFQNQGQPIIDQQADPTVIRHHSPLDAPHDLIPPPPFNGQQTFDAPQNPSQNPLPPKLQLPEQPPQIQFNNPLDPQIAVVPANAPRLDSGRNSGANIVSTNGNKENTFGTFQSDKKNKADTHFRVIQGSENVDSTTSATRSRVPSPQPVYIPTTDAPKPERGFKPITKPNASTQKPNTTPSAETKEQFSAPKDESLVSNKTPAKNAAQTSSNNAGKTNGGFKPIPSPVDSPKKEKENQKSTVKISPVTSGIFKTSTTPTPGQKPASQTSTTSRPAVFVRTATQKSFRVVTSSSVVVPESSNQQVPLPDLKRPERNQQSNPSSFQTISNNQVKPQNTLPRLPIQQHTPSVSQLVRQQAPAGQQVTRPNVPPQPRPAVQQQGPSVQKLNPVLQFTQQAPGAPAVPTSNEANTGFVRTNVPTFVKVVDHRPAQGFGLGSKPVQESTTTTTTTTTPMPIYALDPFYGSRLSRTDVIFHQLGVEEEGCREQVVCNIYKNPDVYTPYSDFLSRQLTVKLEELQRPKVSDERILRFFRYLKAARDGQDGSDCAAKYPECAIDTAQLSHKPIMNAFSKISTLMSAAGSS